MSWQCENQPDEVSDLVGATIVAAKIAKAGCGEVGTKAVRLTVRFRDGFKVNDSDKGTYEVWQDPEGNGPGFLAYMGPTS